MRIALGILTVAAGVAGSTMWLVPSTVESGLAVVSDIGAGGVARLSTSSDKPGVHRQDVAAAEPDHVSRFFGAALPVTAVRPPTTDTTHNPTSATTTTATTISSSTWSTDVEVHTRREQSSAAARAGQARVVNTSSAITSKPLTRQDLARALQAELKRVGCYVGEVDGEWGPASRRSLRAFIEQVNSGLSGDEPDLIQLTLVRGYPGSACRSAPGIAAGTMTATRPLPPLSGPTLVPARPLFAASAPTFAAAPVPAAATVSQVPIVTGTIDTPPSGAIRPASFEGRMAVGASVPPDASAGDATPINAALPPPRTQRPRPASQAAQRRERAWTGTFFNQ